MTTTPLEDYFTSIGEYFLNLDLDGARYLHFLVDYYGDYDLSVSEGGILEPGAYTLVVSANSRSGGGDHSDTGAVDVYI